MVSAAVAIQSLLALLKLTSDVAGVVARMDEGEDITDEEWAELQEGLNKANDDWENA